MNLQGGGGPTSLEPDGVRRQSPDIEINGDPLTVPPTPLTPQHIAYEFARVSQKGSADSIGMFWNPMESAARPSTSKSMEVRWQAVQSALRFTHSK